MNDFVVVVMIIIIITVVKAKAKKVNKQNAKGKVNNTVNVPNQNRYKTINSHYNIETLQGNKPNPVSTNRQLNTTTPAQTNHNNNRQNQDNYYNSLNKKYARKKENLCVMEDREHDWLTQQLKEEKRAYQKVSDMLQLKQLHSSNCSAGQLKEFHQNRCDADGVDTGLGKRF